MPKKLFYSQLTGRPLENAVILNGVIMDRSEAEDIHYLTNPVLDKRDSKNIKVVSSNEIESKDFNNPQITDLSTFKDQALFSKIAARFLQPLIDTAYNISSWPRPSVLREQEVMVAKASASSASAPPQDLSVSDRVMEPAAQQVFGADASVTDKAITVAANPQNKRLAALLSRYSMAKFQQIPQKIIISGLNYSKIIEEAEFARKLIINMRRVLISAPPALVYTDEIKAQQKIIFSLSCLDKPLMTSKVISETASLQDALEILKTFSVLQMNSTARLFHANDMIGADKAAHTWHKFIAEDEQYTSIENYGEPFKNQYKNIISKYCETYNDDLIYMGELSRLILKEFIPLSKKHPDLDSRFSFSSGWSQALQDQHALIKGLGNLSTGFDESLMIRNTPIEYRHERAKIYFDTAMAVCAISRRMCEEEKNNLVSRMKPGEKSWHEIFATMNLGRIHGHVMHGAKKPTDTPTRDTFNIEGPFAELEYRSPPGFIESHTFCHLNKKPTKDPVVFLDGYVYDKTTLENRLRFSKVSPMTGVDFSSVITADNPGYVSVKIDLSAEVYKDSPPAYENLTSVKPSVHMDIAGPSTTQDNVGEDLKGLIPFEGSAMRTNNTVTLTPSATNNNGLLGTYTSYTYKNEALSWDGFVTAVKRDLEYLKGQGIIQSYQANPTSKDFSLYGYDKDALVYKGERARRLLLAVKDATVDDNFERRMFSRPRPGMHLKQDSGRLPDHVFYQSRAILSDDGLLSRDARNGLVLNFSFFSHRFAFEYLASARQVIELAYKGASSNSSYPILRDKATQDWYSIFQSNIETEYTEEGHYETKTVLPYDFVEMAAKVTGWVDQRNTEHKKAVPAAAAKN